MESERDMAEGKMESGQRAPWLGLLLGLLPVLLVVGTVSAVLRNVQGARHPYPTGAMAFEGTGDASWFSMDPDGLYHTRRVERALAESNPIAGRDPLLNHPEGAPIPWPPYYDALLRASAAPFTPEDPVARRRFLEEWVATVPMVCGVLNSLLIALAAACLAGLPAALLAGLLHACAFASVNYSTLGAGDHHAFVALLLTALTAGLAFALRRDQLESKKRGLACGILLGVLAGVLVGSWVASLLYVIQVQCVLALLILRRGRHGIPALVPLGIAFHLAALVTLLPAVLGSPWLEVNPWMVVNLTWFHPLFLAVGALVFVPLGLLGGGSLAPGETHAKRYGIYVAGGLLLLAGAFALVGSGPAAGVSEGFAWVSRADAFMSVVKESWPLLGERADGLGVFMSSLGWLSLLAPLAFVFAVREVWVRGSLALLPWVVGYPILGLQALQQRRFADAWCLFTFVLLGWALGRLLSTHRDAPSPGAEGQPAEAKTPPPRWVFVLSTTLVLILVPLSFGQGFRDRLSTGFDDAATFWGSPIVDDRLGRRAPLEWLRRYDQRTPNVERGAVMAHWDLGHEIEWIADRPSVATNFGSYVGVEGFRAPSEFFLATGEAQGLGVLARRGATHVYATAWALANLPTLLQVQGLDGDPNWIDAQGRPTQAWGRTLSAALLPVTLQRSRDAEQLTAPLFERLRLIHAGSSFRTQAVDPRTNMTFRCGWIWERVEGAVLELEATPGSTLEVELQLEFPNAALRPRITLRKGVQADPSGKARLRVPYATATPNGDGRVVAARWSSGVRGGTVNLTESDVRTGAVIPLN